MGHTTSRFGLLAGAADQLDLFLRELAWESIGDQAVLQAIGEQLLKLIKYT